MKKKVIAKWSKLEEKKPEYALVADVDLVIIPYKDTVSVLYGRCLHRGALLSDGYIDGDNLICGVHYWDYRYDTGVSEYNNEEALPKFTAGVDHEKNEVWVDEEEVAVWAEDHPQPYNRDEYLGLYADTTGTEDESENSYIQQLAKKGVEKIGHHGPVSAMGTPRHDLPHWKDIQIITAQLHRPPLLDDETVQTKLVIGPNAKKPLELDIPLLISDMSFGALSEEAKIAMSRGAELAGTGICSGEGGMLDDEQAANSRYLYELASGQFGYSMEKVEKCQAFHFKAGQGAKTGTGGHLPGKKVTKRIADVRGLNEGEDAVSPSRFKELKTPEDYRREAEKVRSVTGGVPIGFKLSAQHIEKDIEFALQAGADYLILDGRGGGTGAAPNIFKDHISVPTIPALARARRYLDSIKANDITLIITGGLRTDADFFKALALGADGVAIANSAMQAIGCLGMRACDSDNCPVGIATQKEHLRNRLMIESSATMLKNFLEASVHLMKVMSRACGHLNLSELTVNDLSTYKKEMHELTGIPFGGVI